MNKNFYIFALLHLLWLCALCTGQSTRTNCDLTNCTTTNVKICASNGQLCKRFTTECSLRRENCNATLATVWNRTDTLQCLNLRSNASGVCACPALRTCSNRPTPLVPGICVHRSGLNCRLFSTECDLTRARCNGEVWHNIDVEQCKGFTLGQTGNCSCPQTIQCSRNTTEFCVRVGANNNCRRYDNRCDLEAAKCRGGEILTTISQLHCMGFNNTQTRNCTCPNLMTCSRNNTNFCVKTARGCKLLSNECELEQLKCQGANLTILPAIQCRQLRSGIEGACACPNLLSCQQNTSNNTNICIKTATGCKLLRNECELEELKCQGANLTVLPAIQCQQLRSGNDGSCACPNWLSCQQNTTQVCVETVGGCRLLKNQCDLEQLKCQGVAFNVTNILQCQGFREGQLRNCACPELKTCSLQNYSRVCVKNENGCKLMANSCDLELAKCKGEKWCSVDLVQCQNFTINQQSPCKCPKMETCAQNNSTNICVNLKGACKLMKNQCELEKDKCKGHAWSPTSSIQCTNYKPNEWRWCACPRLLNCCTKEKQFCVKSPQGCKLMKTECEYQMARCKGEAWLKADALECKGFTMGEEVQTCTCPKLATCHQRESSAASTKVCVRNIKGCKLLRNDCELERSLCNGEVWQRVEDLQCRNFPLHETRSCHCPSLDSCSNTTQVCARAPTNQCSHFGSECDLKRSQCEGEELSLTKPQRCQGFRVDTSDECRCPELRGCNRRRTICGRRGQQCKLFGNECDYRNSTCLEENWQRTSLANCCRFNPEEVKNCTLNLSTAVCGTDSRMCRLFASRCELDAINLTAPREWIVVNRSNCKCLRAGRTAGCTRRPTCRPTNSSRVCARHGRIVQLFRSQCHLSHHNFNRCTNFTAVSASLCRNMSV